MSLNNKVIKFAKYGIVLVATITVATAAQSQGIGIATQHVYAEEATSYSEDYRMFYIKDSFYPNLEDYMGLSGRVTTTNEPYTVEEGFTTPEYPYYTIVGSDGKTYSVGDTITVDNPLVNHPNENDNVLYYYHYPSDPNAATSEAPAPSVSPSTSESPNTSTSPSTSEAPAPSTAPSTSEASKPAVEKPSQKADDKTTATDKAKDTKANKADSKPAKADKSKDANSKKAAAAKDNSVENKAEKANANSAPAEQAKTNANPSVENSQAIVKEASGTVDTAANHNNNSGFFATLLGFAAFVVTLFGLFQNKEEK
jgi:hypothetical protein